MAEVESREWYVAAYAAEGVPTSDHLKLRTVTLSLSPDSVPEQHVILETLFISVEPYLRSRITGREDGLCSPQFNLDEVIASFGVGRVIRSKDSNYVEGDIVVSPFTSFAEYCVVPSQFITRKTDPNNGIPLPEYISWLGMLHSWWEKHLTESSKSEIRNAVKKDEEGILIFDETIGRGIPDAVWTEREGVRNLLNLIAKEVNMQGFMVGSYLHRFEDFATEMERHLKQGKIGYSKLKIFHGIEKFLESLGSLFTSSNVGKVVIQVK